MVARGSPNHDHLGKLWPFIDNITRKFTIPIRSLHEATIRRSSLKQYMPLKPVKRGIKVWVLADSNNGYISKLLVYTGKEDSPEKALGTRVVKQLTGHFHGKKHHVFFDNFITSKELVDDLEKDGIYGCGTARKNRRGFPGFLGVPGEKV